MTSFWHDILHSIARSGDNSVPYNSSPEPCIHAKFILCVGIYWKKSLTSIPSSWQACWYFTAADAALLLNSDSFLSISVNCCWIFASCFFWYGLQKTNTNMASEKWPTAHWNGKHHQITQWSTILSFQVLIHSGALQTRAQGPVNIKIQNL